MRRVIWLVAILAVAVAIAWYLAGLTGMVTLDVAGLTIETRAGLAVLGAVVVVVLLLALLWLLLGLAALPRRWRARRTRRHRARGDAAVGKTLVAIAAADAPAARRGARQARRFLGDTPQTLLLDAESERLAGNEGAAEAIYRRMADREDAAFLGLRGLFRQALAREDWEGAAEIAKKAEAAYPGAGWLKEERTALAVRTKDWHQALKLSGPGPSRAAFATAAAAATEDPQHGLALAKRAWKDDKSFVPAALAYASRLRAAGQEGRAQSVLAESWGETPHPALAELALEPVTDKLARIAAARRVTRTAPEHAEAHFLLARESLAAGLTGEAHRHAEAARQAGMNEKRLYLLLAELAASEGNTAAQRDALLQAARAEPDSTWRCEACGSVQEHWHPACPVCHTPGSLAWGRPRLLALPGTAA